MHNYVVIKGNKAGLTVYLDHTIPFYELLKALAAKFKETARFWGAVQMTLTLEGRDLTSAEEFQIVNTITENSNIEILCLLDTDAERIERCEKALNEKLLELSSQTGQFYRGDLKSGDVLESEASIVVIGDVERGAKIVAKGNVIVLGSLKGAVSAGVTGNMNSVIVALEMAPSQVKIAELSLERAERGRPLGRGPMVILGENGRICLEAMKKSFLSALNFI